MNEIFETNLVFFPEKIKKEIFEKILSLGTGEIKNSKKMDKYKCSLREVFGLYILGEFRNFLEPEKKWVLLTDSKISDDGSIAEINEDNTIVYYENIEQVYLPGIYLKRESKQTINDYILNHISRTKDKGWEYKKDKSLFILSDIQSKNCDDIFDWQGFVKSFFKEKTFLHMYLVALVSHTTNFNKYYLLSFTNQKHRQDLNGEFEFKLNTQGIYDFKCIQEINLLKTNK